MFAGKKSAQIREILISESAWEEMTCLFAPSLNVWDNYGLSSSNQRLWQVMNALKIKLNSVGVTEDFIMRVESKGYYVRENLVNILYTNKKSSFAGNHSNADQVIS